MIKKKKQVAKRQLLKEQAVKSYTLKLRKHSRICPEAEHRDDSSCLSIISLTDLYVFLINSLLPPPNPTFP